MRNQAISGFEDLYGYAPQGLWSAPGRVNLIGEHTDYNGGFVFPFAINKRTFVALGARNDSKIRVSSEFEKGLVEIDLKDLTPESVSGWSAYPLGVAWAFKEMGTDIESMPGVDLFIVSEVPVGAGLSSSAAIECAVAMALNDVWGTHIDKPTLAKIGQIAENKAVGAPTGIMDQSASMLGRRDAGVFLDCRSLQAEVVPLGFENAGLELLVIDTKVKHSHSTGGYAQRRASCEKAAKAMGVETLRDLSVSDLGRLKELCDDETYRRACHVITENDRVEKVIDLIKQGKTTEIGPYLDASHVSMRDDFEISVPELNVAVETSLANGAIGSRMTGGGFGGAAIALVPCDLRSSLEEKILTAFEENNFIKPDIFVVSATNGASMDQAFGAGLVSPAFLPGTQAALMQDEDLEDDMLETEGDNGRIELKFSDGNKTSTAIISTDGATLRKLWLNDTEVVQGFDTNQENLKSAGDILIPWPNRIKDGKWTLEGKELQLKVNETERNNAIHGLIRDLKHIVVVRKESYVVLRARIVSSTGYPFTLEVETKYELELNELKISHKITNFSKNQAPVAFGAHPYLKIGDTPTEELFLRLKANSRVAVDDRLNPIGIEEVQNTSFDLNTPTRVGDLDLDTAYCDLVSEADGTYRHRLSNEQGQVVEVFGDENFKHAQVYNTKEFEIGNGLGWAVAVEPTTAPPNAFNSGTDLKWVQPNETWNIAWGISLNK